MIKYDRVCVEKKRILNNFTVNPQGKYRAVTKVVRAILLNGPFFGMVSFMKLKLSLWGLEYMNSEQRYKNEKDSNINLNSAVGWMHCNAAHDN